MINAKINKQQVKQAFAGAANSYDDLAQLQRHIGRQLLNRFPLPQQSGTILDLGCGTGFISQALPVNHKTQTLIAMDIALPMLKCCRAKHYAKSIALLCADAESLPFRPNTIQQIYSNLVLQWCDLPKVFANCQQVLSQDGQLVFTTFGDKTLQELKLAWMSVDDYAHVNHFYHAEQIADYLQAAGFAVIDLELQLYQQYYLSVMHLMRELKGIGAHTVNQGRNPKPTTYSQLQQMCQNYPGMDENGRIMASYQVVFVKAIPIK